MEAEPPQPHLTPHLQRMGVPAPMPGQQPAPMAGPPPAQPSGPAPAPLAGQELAQMSSHMPAPMAGYVPHMQTTGAPAQYPGMLHAQTMGQPPGASARPANDPTTKDYFHRSWMPLHGNVFVTRSSSWPPTTLQLRDQL